MAKKRLRVATYNIRHAEGLDGRVDLERIAANLRSLKAQVIGLQEVDVGLARSGGIDQALELGRLADLHVRFWPTIAHKPGHYGLALATAAKVESRFQALPHSPGDEPRGFITAELDGLAILVTHLTLGRPARRAQLHRLAEAARERGGPVVLLGDLNERRWGLRSLRRAGLASDGAWHRTFRVGLPRHIDHVMCGGGARVERSWTADVEGSDHRPLVADIIY